MFACECMKARKRVSCTCMCERAGNRGTLCVHAGKWREKGHAVNACEHSDTCDTHDTGREGPGCMNVYVHREAKKRACVQRQEKKCVGYICTCEDREVKERR